MKLIMKHTANFIATEATQGKQESINRITELQAEVIGETEQYYLLKSEPLTDETYSI